MNALTLRHPEPQSSSALELWEARTQSPSEGLVHVSQAASYSLLQAGSHGPTVPLSETAKGAESSEATVGSQ